MTFLRIAYFGPFYDQALRNPNSTRTEIFLENENIVYNKIFLKRKKN